MIKWFFKSNPNNPMEGWGWFVLFILCMCIAAYGFSQIISGFAGG